MNKKLKGLLLSISLFLVSFSFVMAANYDSINSACSGYNVNSTAACSSFTTGVTCPNGGTATYSTGNAYYISGTSYGGCTCTCVGGSATTTIKDNAGLSTRTVPEIIGNGIKVILGLSGTIALIFVIVGGVKWMGSKGEATKIKAARDIMTSGVVGIIIIAAAYAITDFVIKQLSAAV